MYHSIYDFNVTSKRQQVMYWPGSAGSQDLAGLWLLSCLNLLSSGHITVAEHVRATAL